MLTKAEYVEAILHGDSESLAEEGKTTSFYQALVEAVAIRVVEKMDGND